MFISNLSLVLTTLFLAAHAHGTVITTIADEDNGSLDPTAGGGNGVSLREGIRYSGDGATLTFAPSLAGQTIRLTLGTLVAGSAQMIDGSNLSDRITVSGDKTGDGPSADDVRIISMGSKPVVLDSILFEGGNAGTTGNGGAIRNDSFTNTPVLTVRNCSFLGNRAAAGGAIYMGPPKATPTTGIVIERCRFLRNSATGNGGGISSASDVSASDSEFKENTADKGAGIHVSGQSAILIDRCSVEGNISANSGGGCYLESSDTRATTVSNSVFYDNISGASATTGAGGGVYIKANPGIVSNTTVANNSAKSSGGGIYNAGNLSVLHSTISNNAASLYAGGIMHSPLAIFLTVGNSIVTGNQVQNIGIYQNSAVTDTLTSGDPRLAPLGDYGGPTHSMPPLPGSPAINSGGTSSITTDQRGRPRDITPDLGAAEYLANSDLSRFWSLDPDADGFPLGVELATGTDNFTPDAGSSRNPKPPVIDGEGHAVLSFGIGNSAPAGTTWTLWRSPNLIPGNFVQIYRFDGNIDTAVPGIDFTRTTDGVTITDLEPVSGQCFYRFKSELNP